MSGPVLIAGAGVSGLALAQGLIKRGIDVRIFERDQSFNTRTQGYRVRVAQDGLAALSANLPRALYDELERCCPPPRNDGNVPSAVLDAKTAGRAKSLFHGQRPPNMPGPGTIWSVDRGVLRKVLSTDLAGVLEFRKELHAFDADDEGVTVTFKDGSSARGSMLVGLTE